MALNAGFTVTPTRLPDVMVVEPRVFGDERGFFMESWNQAALDAAVGQPLRFVQDNHSRSVHGVLRGLHYQVEHAQGKLVRAVAGRIYDVAVDMRRSSPRFGQWVGVELSSTNHKQLWVPPGFAHGFLVLSESADVLYKTTDYYAPEHERALIWNDPQVAIDWPVSALKGAPTLSPKDLIAPAWGACAFYS